MPRRHASPDVIEAALGFRFANHALLYEALTHASQKSTASNERLEFLGDRVLGLAIAEALVERHPEENEGQLAPRLNALVSRETCAAIAERIGLGDHMVMAKAEAHSGGRRKPALLANVMEAVIAAIYLDAGMEASRSFILHHWAHLFDAQTDAPIDPKTALQEWAQARGRALPFYETIAQDGPDHAPRFTVRVTLDDGKTAQAVAASKRAGERESAKLLLDTIEGRA